MTLSDLVWTLQETELADASFEHRPTESDCWSATDTTTLSRWRAVERTVSDLPPSTQCEYRSVVPTVGDTQSFHTLASDRADFDSQ